MLPSTTSASVPTDSQTPRGNGAQAVATALAALICLLAELPGLVVDALGVRGWGLAVVVVVAVVSGARTVLWAPLTLASTLRQRPRPPALRRWAGEQLTTFLASTAVAAAVAIPLYGLLRATPWWWLAVWALSASVTVGWQLALPAVLRARSGGLAPAPDHLAARLGMVAACAGAGAPEVVVAGRAGRRSCNAYVAGLGPTRRIVLEPAIVAWPPELVDQAVAHEFGHWRLRHAARRLPLTLLAQLATLAAAAAALASPSLLAWAGVPGVGSPLSYPLLLTVGAVVAVPARVGLAWHDRAQERAADRFALALLGRPADFAAMLDRAAGEGGAPRDLPWWRRVTASHPPIDERAADATRLDLAPAGG
ncbi:MAG TPA: M48 family metalloprotease [Acidimicrobiales bacterium]|nr:M48 family metalloprotease [Acidimicrobiales bacterium]